MPDRQLVNEKVYRDYNQQELDAQYNQASIVANNADYQAFKKAESARVREKLDSVLNVPYGPSQCETLDIFKADRLGAPILLFIHGGAWKSGSKNDVSYVAESYVQAGANCIVIDFALVPNVRLQEQVHQAATAISWAYRNAQSYGGDPERIFVVGHSSGGHVTGMMAVTNWERDFGLPADILKGAVPLSGMFDLNPVQLSWRNSYLNISRAEALALSPIHHIPKRPMPLIIGYGSKELAEFQRQSREFSAAWQAAGHPTTEILLEGCNHFDVQREINNPSGPIVSAICEMMGLGTSEQGTLGGFKRG